MNFILKLIITTLAVLLVAYILPGVHVQNIMTALIVACVLAFLNSIIKPLLVLFTLPLTIITLGLFLLVINALIILLTEKLVDGFSVKNFGVALVFSILLSITTSILEMLSGNKPNS
ncbi:MAG: phage holin family protein [Bacteroidetes bacterium]|nr:phage holin family protein [Bacteroidota bacterium]